MSDKGPNFDRALMRIKDFIIIGTALFAMVRWAYLRTEDMSQRFKTLEERVGSLERMIVATQRKS